VTSSFGFPNDFAVIAMNYFDRVLSRSNPLPNSKQEIQLLALTCFYLSVKLFQAGPILSTDQICMISGYAFLPAQIVAMEQRILRTIDWCLYPPTPSEFLQPYIQILLCHSSFPFDLYGLDILELSQSIVNELILDYYFVANQCLPSHIAVAAIINAMATILPINAYIPSIHDAVQVLTHYTRYQFNERDIVLYCHRLWGLMNTNQQHDFDKAMIISYNTSFSNIDHRSNSPTPNSPVGVTSYSTFNYKDEPNHNYLYESMMQPTNTFSTYTLSFVRE
jgi:hypothetical protein